MIALVTGASRGIGAAIAQRLASAGAVVAVSARSLDSTSPEYPGTLREVVATIEARGGRALAIQGDMANADSRLLVKETCPRELGPIEIPVNNAAYGPYRPFSEFRETDQRTFEMNLSAPGKLTSRIAYSGHFVREIGRPIRALDGGKFHAK